MNARLRLGLTITVLASTLLVGSPRVADAQPGKYIASNGWRDFSGGSFTFAKSNNGVNLSDYVAATYYFYWYDDTTGRYLFTDNTPVPYDTLGIHPTYVNPRPIPAEGVAHRPWGSVSTPPRFSYTDVGWHQREVQQIADAGLDLLLVDYWGRGDDRDADSWQNVGLSALDKAAANLGPNAPKLAMFYDTNTLFAASPPRIEFDDFTANGLANARAFYHTIRDFYSRVNPSRWGRFNNAAIVWLYTSNTTKDNRPLYFRSHRSRLDLFAYCRQEFARDFGGGSNLFFVGDIGWALVQPSPLRVDMQYGWGAASTPSHVFAAPHFPFDVNSVGARFDVSTNFAVQRAHNRFTGISSPSFPCDKDTFTQAWQEANSGPNRVIAVETWNELLESTGILPSVEFGTMYYDITKKGVNTLHFRGDFVRQAYLYQLNRPVDGLGYGTNTVALDNKSLFPSVLRDNLLNSNEATARTPDASYVDFLHQRYLRRAPTDQETAGWSARLRSGVVTRSAARDAFVSSEEAQRAISNGDFVTALFAQFLNRAPDPIGYDLFLKSLSQGTPRSQLIAQLLNSDEFTEQDLSPRNKAFQPARLFDFAGY